MKYELWFEMGNQYEDDYRPLLIPTDDTVVVGFVDDWSAGDLGGLRTRMLNGSLYAFEIGSAPEVFANCETEMAYLLSEKVWFASAMESVVHLTTDDATREYIDNDTVSYRIAELDGEVAEDQKLIVYSSQWANVPDYAEVQEA